MDPFGNCNGATDDGVSRRVAIQAGLVGLGGLLVACSSGDDSGDGADGPGSTGTGTGTGTASNAGGGGSELTTATLIAAIASDVGSLDPQSLGGTGGGNWPSYAVHFNGPNSELTKIDPETLDLHPGLADSWEMSEDGLTWTILLNSTATFHSGEPVTAEDVKFSMDRNIGKATYNPEFQAGYSGQFTPIVESVEAVDATTVVFHLLKPDVVFMTRPLYVLPKAYVEEVGDDGFAAAPIGTGQFKFVSRVADSETLSERYDDYYQGFDSPSGVHTAYVQNLVQKIIPEDQARLAALQAGEVDLIHNVSADIARQLESDDQYRVYYLSGSQPMQIAINTAFETDPVTGGPNPWRDKRVRLAANHAIDLDAIISSILTGREVPTFGSSSLGLGFPADLPDKRFQYDPDEARRLLADAGYESGFETAMFGPIGRWPNSRPVMEAVTQYVAEVGITSTIQELQYQEVTTRFQDKSMGPLVFWGQSGGPDPALNFRYSYHSSGNYNLGTAVDIEPEGDITADIDGLIEESEAEFDPEKRVPLLNQIITDFYLSAKSIWLYEPVTVVVAKSSVEWTPWAKDISTPEYWNMRVS